MLPQEVSKRVDISILIRYSGKVSRSGECFHFHIGMRAGIVPLNLPKELTSKSYRSLTDCAILQHKKSLLVSARRLAKPPNGAGSWHADSRGRCSIDVFESGRAARKQASDRCESAQNKNEF